MEKSKVEDSGVLTFKGRPILAGDVEGEAVVSHRGFNTYASFSTSMLTNAEVAICSDRSNAGLHGKELTGKILCVPKTIGSTSSGAVWQRIVQMGIAPKAVLFSGQIDSLATGGLIVADVWTDKRIITIDNLGDEFLEFVQDGDRIEIKLDGTVSITERIADLSE
jgi:predicted aconitase with swiveling domain